jgi:sulfate adenylyltransferase
VRPNKKMQGLVPPHGTQGELRPLLIEDEALRTERRREARSLPKVKMTTMQASDSIMLAMGAFTPLEGFMGKEDYDAVLSEMRLQSGVLFPVPITLTVSSERGESLKENQRIALINPEGGEVMGVMELREKYAAETKREAMEVFGTGDENHPGVKKLYQGGEVCLSGPLEVLSEGDYPTRFADFARPAETRELFAEKGWSTVAGFQTRNPMHRSHEYLTKIALEICDGLLIHPIVGKLKPGDIPADVRTRCYHTLLDNYYPRDRAIMKVYPMEMRYAGPREALLHAIIRQNFGCSHLIVGRDHAGVGDYYSPFDAQEIFDQLRDDDLAIRPLKMDHAFWCHKCQSIVSRRTCGHGNEDRLTISGTELRRMLAAGTRPPDQFSRPEVIDILMDYYSARSEAQDT